MHIDYFETAALVGVGRPGYRVTLDDLHKAAWTLYTGSGKHEIPPNTPRPFVFSADPVPGRENVFLFTIRSAAAFPRADAKTLKVEDGSTWMLGLRFKATANRKLWNEAKQRHESKRQLVHNDAIESDIITPALSRFGLEVLNVSLEGPTFMKQKAEGFQRTLPPLWYATIEAVVSDPLLFANGWTAGVTHGRAYGLGMLSPLSIPQAAQVA